MGDTLGGSGARSPGSTLRTWVARSPLVVPMLAATAIVALQCWFQFSRASAQIDGVRWFWLDDDQMISMRYGRNLAEGLGLVWNRGDYVEGYTNPLWTLVMAAVHALGASDAHAALWVKLINTGLELAVIGLALQLARQWRGVSSAALLLLAVLLAVCGDLGYWAQNGFEVPLLQFVFLLALRQLVADDVAQRTRPWAYLFASLLPLVRSDAAAPWLTIAAVALADPRDRKLKLTWLAASLLPMLAHVMWRHEYYGQWLPNTFYAKALDVPNRFNRSIEYLRRCGAAYAVPVLLAFIGARVRGDRWRVTLLSAGVATMFLYVMATGGDVFPFCRFAAWMVPPLLVMAVVAADRDVADWRRPALVVLAVLVALQAGITRRSLLDSANGGPRASIEVGLYLRRIAKPDAAVAVTAAGLVPYFSRLRAIDALGKCDAGVARLPSREGAPIGHGKFDANWSLRSRPEFVVALLSPSQVASGAREFLQMGELPEPQHRYVFVESSLFRAQYLPNVLPMQGVARYASLFVRADVAAKYGQPKPSTSLH